MQTIDAIIVRSGTRNDSRLIAELARQTFHDSFAADNGAADMQAYLDAAFGEAIQASELADPASTFLIAEMRGAAVGYARLIIEPCPPFIRCENPIHLQRIYAIRECIGRGVGPALMAACIDIARKRGCGGIWLGVWERNLRAIRFYRKWGFTAAGTLPFQLGSDRQTDQILQRLLDATEGR